MISLSKNMKAAENVEQVGNLDQGNAFFQQNCAICHADHLSAEEKAITKQGPSLVGVLGRRAGSSLDFNYSRAMSDSTIKWDASTLDRFLTNPMALIPGTTMPITITNTTDRLNVIAYLSSLTSLSPLSSAPETKSPTSTSSAASLPNDLGDWRHAIPGKVHHLTVHDLPAPFSTQSAGNHPKVIPSPEGATPAVPAGFKVQLFAKGLSNPRMIKVAPNGDIFVAETGSNRLRILRADDGKDLPTINQIFVENLDRPFGIAFFPSGNNPEWIYVANNNSVVRFPYHNGDLKARGGAKVILSKLSNTAGGHSTRDITFSKDDKRMFISVGSASNVAEKIRKKSSEEIKEWESAHGKGAAWDEEENRADILVTDPEGQEPLRTFATGIRNGVGLALNEESGDLWVTANERDGLGDNLVPDYVTRVKEGGFYGWPWYYIGNHEDPRKKGERPDLRNESIIQDVLFQSHSAPLALCFYTASQGSSLFPAEYRGDAFVALHGSWNRAFRTGYKLVRVRLNHGIPTGEYEDFLTGFVVDNQNVWGRPVGVAVAHDGALLMTEDGNNTIWRISYSEK